MNIVLGVLVNPALGLLIVLSIVILVFVRKTDIINTILKKLSIGVLVYLTLFVLYFVLTQPTF